MELENELRVAKLELNATKEMAKQTQEMALASAVSVKLPPFWSDKAVVWFAQAEAEFTLKNITQDNTKYSYVVAAMTTEASTQVMDFLQAPPTQNKYEAIKARLLEAFTLSDREKSARILDTNGLGDAKPSALLGKMLALVPAGEQPGFLFRELFLRQLPSDIQTHLAQSNKIGYRACDLRALAKDADQFFISSGARISSASEEVNAAYPRYGGAERKSTGDNPGGDKRRKGVRMPPCWAHYNFGAKARKCTQPCGWTKSKASENEEAGRPQ